jgi:predicted Ser/Thr protein kinase
MENTAPPERLGRYEIVRELGKGAMGVVYEGRDPSLGRTVAIKTARQDVIEKSGLAKEMMERFLREARAAGVLNHPNIITIYDVGEEAGMAYIAMEYLVGKDLNDEIEEKKHFEPDEAVKYGVQICEALACAHDQGVFHRDVKPANIFIPDKGALKVVDFGIARTHDSTLTQDGALIGTPTYMSPEQFMGRKVDGRSDLFSAGIIMYEMLTGEKPFTGEALTTIMHHILKSDPAPPSELNYTVPEALSAVVMRALSKKPQDRYSDGRAMAAALRESLKDNPDMTIIKGKPVVIAETVISSTPIAASDGTVMDATAPGSAPAPAQDATVVGTAPAPAQDATVIGNAPEAAAPAKPAAPVAASVPVVAAPKPNLMQLAMQHSRIVLGGIAVFCLIAGFGMYLMAPAPAPEGEQPPVEAVAPENTPGDTPAGSELKSGGVYVYTTNDAEVALEFDEKLRAGQDLTAWLDTIAGTIVPVEQKDVSVRTSNVTTGTVYDEKTLSDGFASVSVPAGEAEVRYEILQKGQVLLSTDVKIDAQGPVGLSFVVHKSVLQP